MVRLKGVEGDGLREKVREVRERKVERKMSFLGNNPDYISCQDF